MNRPRLFFQGRTNSQDPEPILSGASRGSRSNLKGSSSLRDHDTSLQNHFFSRSAGESRQRDPLEESDPPTYPASGAEYRGGSSPSFEEDVPSRPARGGGLPPAPPINDPQGSGPGSCRSCTAPDKRCRSRASRTSPNGRRRRPQGEGKETHSPLRRSFGPLPALKERCIPSSSVSGRPSGSSSRPARSPTEAEHPHAKLWNRPHPLPYRNWKTDGRGRRERVGSPSPTTP